jgi:hypothetical protein
MVYTDTSVLDSFVVALLDASNKASIPIFSRQPSMFRSSSSFWTMLSMYFAHVAFGLWKDP